MLFRQERALKLDQDDGIVRRRVVQKEQVLVQNRQAPAEPTEAEPLAFYARRLDRYPAASRAMRSPVFFAVGAIVLGAG
jgi:hypothetical protein